MGSSDRLRTVSGAVRRLPTFRRDLRLFIKDHGVLLEQVRRHEQQLARHAERLVRLEDGVRGVSESIDRLHASFAEADPHLAYEIVTTIRDDVRSLLVEVSEQANQARDRLVEQSPAAQG